MRCKDILNKQVLNLENASQIGLAEDVVLDLEGNFVALIVRQTGLLTRHLAISADRIEAVGPDAITVQTAEAIDADKMPALKLLPTMRAIRHCLAMTSRGNYLGPIVDLTIDPDLRQVTHYLIRGAGILSMRRNRLRNSALPASGRVRFGRRLAIFWEDELFRLQPWPSPKLGEPVTALAALGPGTSPDAVVPQVQITNS